MMLFGKHLIAAGIAVATIAGIGCAGKPGADRARLQRFAPLPEVIPAKAGAPAEDLIALGRMLYFDPRLSKSQTISCNSCHPLDRYGADGQPTSTGYKGQHGGRNSPSVYNAAAQFVQFWDGRAPDVEQQAKGPMLNPVEMAMPSGAAVTKVLRSIPGYAPAFRRAFPGDRNPVTFDHAAEAIGAFERRLVTPARWDKFLRGDAAALTQEEKAGLDVFVSTGCSNCHAGALVGGNAFQRLGVTQSWPDTSDAGRYQVTKNEADRMFFKVPSLRNVAMTGPYFHDGRIEALGVAVGKMAEYQLGNKLTDSQAAAIVTWLKSLTGDLPVEFIKAPALPKSSLRTSKAAAAD